MNLPIKIKCSYKPLQSANEELWEGLITTARAMLTSSNQADDETVWGEFPCDEWPKTQTHLKSEHFHQWPHVGELQEENLVDI